MHKLLVFISMTGAIEPKRSMYGIFTCIGMVSGKLYSLHGV